MLFYIRFSNVTNENKSIACYFIYMKLWA